LLVGGDDDEFQNAARRDGRVESKARSLLREVLELLPHLALEVEFAWAGTFGETEDGLAYIGQSPELPHAYFALGFGGNGITFGAIAADILLDLIAGRPNADARIFRFGR
jgi:glycine/D-amino acid oxidase-like deaminating enzyme